MRIHRLVAGHEEAGLVHGAAECHCCPLLSLSLGWHHGGRSIRMHMRTSAGPLYWTPEN